MAGPYSKGDTALNVRRAIEAGHLLMEAGHTPFIPHLTHFWHLLFPRPYEEWLAYDNQWVTLCHGLLRLKGESNGADKEVALATKNKMPVFFETSILAGASRQANLESAIKVITKHWEVID